MSSLLNPSLRRHPIMNPIDTIRRSLFRSKTVSRELPRFILVGISGFVVGIAIINGLMALHAGFVRSNATSFLVAVTWNFSWNRKLTFPPNSRSSWVVQWIQYIGANLLGTLANWTVSFSLYYGMEFCRDYFNIPVICGVLAGSLVNFCGAKYWVFRPKGIVIDQDAP
jgi:putative flippase GtrA